MTTLFDFMCNCVFLNDNLVTMDIFATVEKSHSTKAEIMGREGQTASLTKVHASPHFPPWGQETCNC